MRLGMEMYRTGDFEAAVAIYSLAAEEGYETAQANAAYLIERQKGYR